MEFLHEAIEANRKGVALLSNGLLDAASLCFKEALVLLPHVESVSPPITEVKCIPIAPPVRLISLSLVRSEDNSFACSCSEDKICLIHLADSDAVSYEMTSEMISMCVVAVIANCAVTCEHQASISERTQGRGCYKKACSLYRWCLELVLQVQLYFDCNWLVQSFAYKIAGCLHELGDFAGIFDLLNAMFLREVHELAQEESKGQTFITDTAA